MKTIIKLLNSILFLVLMFLVLFISTLIITFPASSYIITQSENPVDNFLITSAMMIMVSLTSVMATLLTVRLIWGTNISVISDLNEDIGEKSLMRGMKATMIKKIVILMVFLVANTMIFDTVGRGILITDTRELRILTLLRSPLAEDRKTGAFDAVMLPGDERIASSLGRIIDNPGKARYWAAWATGARRDKKNVKSLRTLLQGGIPSERATAALALARMGDPNIISMAPEVMPFMGNLTGDLILALGKIGVKGVSGSQDLKTAGEFILEYLKRDDIDKKSRLVAIWALGRFNSPLALPLLENTVSSYMENSNKTRDIDILCTSLQALGAIGSADTSPKLVDLLYKIDKTASCSEIVYLDFAGHDELICGSANIITRILAEIAHIGDRRVRTQMEKLAKDKSFPERARKTAGEIVFQMRYSTVK